jgi:6-phosphogluconolactonase (cycloisomerase 2 family)
MAIHPEGSFLYAPCHTNGQIGVYPINSNGSLGTPSIGATTTAINTGFSGHTLLFVSGN